jgi:hypothetical protein
MPMRHVKSFLLPLAAKRPLMLCYHSKVKSSKVIGHIESEPFQLVTIVGGNSWLGLHFVNVAQLPVSPTQRHLQTLFELRYGRLFYNVAVTSAAPPNYDRTDPNSSSMSLYKP